MDKKINTPTASRKYGVGVMGLFANKAEYTDIKDAIAAAKTSKVDFIVEFSSHGKKVLSWNYAIEEKSVLEERYLFDGDKRTILGASDDKYWLTLSKGQPFETILPLSEVKSFEKIDA